MRLLQSLGPASGQSWEMKEKEKHLGHSSSKGSFSNCAFRPPVHLLRIIFKISQVASSVLDVNPVLVAIRGRDQMECACSVLASTAQKGHNLFVKKLRKLRDS